MLEALRATSRGRDWEAIHLRFEQGLSFRETGDRWGVSGMRAKVAVDRGLGRLRLVRKGYETLPTRLLNGFRNNFGDSDVRTNLHRAGCAVLYKTKNVGWKSIAALRRWAAANGLTMACGCPDKPCSTAVWQERKLRAAPVDPPTAAPGVPPVEAGIVAPPAPSPDPAGDDPAAS